MQYSASSRFKRVATSRSWITLYRGSPPNCTKVFYANATVEKLDYRESVQNLHLNNVAAKGI